MNDQEILSKLQLNSRWIELGIITPDLLEEFRKEYESGGDQNSEHYRWRAFSHFVRANEILPQETVRALYGLGDSDPDEMMGGSMMRELLDRKDCPMDVLRAASQSNRDFLVKAANRTIERRLKKGTL